jgi:phosphate-selective porin OprO/OprP
VSVLLAVLGLGGAVCANDPEWLRNPPASREKTWILNESDADPEFPGDSGGGSHQAELDDEPERAEGGDTTDRSADLAERLSKLEDAWEKFQNATADKADEAAQRPTVEIGGRIHVDHWAFPQASDGIGFFEHPTAGSPHFGTDPEDRFDFRRIRLEMNGDILESMLWVMQIDFATADDPTLKDVYLGFRDLPCNQQLLIGIHKRPLGLDHLNSSRFNVFLERPLVVEAFNEDARRLGMSLQGVTEDKVFNWTYGVFNLENTTLDGVYLGDDLQLSANARVASTPWYDVPSQGRCYFHWAIAGMLAHPDGDVNPSNQRVSNSNEARFRTRPEARSSNRWLDTRAIPGARWYEVLALESVWNLGAFQLTGEVQSSWVQRDDRTPGTGQDLFLHGGYLYASYNLTGEHIPMNRTDGTIDRLVPFENFCLVDRCQGHSGHGWGAWQVGMRYSYLNLTSHEIRGGVEHNWTFALNWFWTAHSKLQFNAVYGMIDDHFPVNGYTDGEFWGLGTRFAVDF